MITLQDALSYGRGIERPFNCHVHEDGNASATVNVEKGLWYCHACGAKGKAPNSTVTESVLFHAMEYETVPMEYPESWLDIFDAHFVSPYWAKRYGEQTARKFRCGTDPFTRAPTYPMRSITGKVWGVVRRTGGTPKYLTPSGAKTSMTLFADPALYTPKGLAKKPVIVLVEGPPDVMAMDQAGIPDDWIVAAVFGSSLLNGQVEHIVNASPHTVVCAFDDDDAGAAGVIRAKDRLPPHIHTLSVRWGMFGGKDPGDIPPNKRTLAVEQALKTRKTS